MKNELYRQNPEGEGRRKPGQPDQPEETRPEQDN